MALESKQMMDYGTIQKYLKIARQKDAKEKYELEKERIRVELELKILADIEAGKK